MGLAASQARLLSITARIHDVEYQAQMIQNAKLKLALNEDAVLKKYNEALDAETLTFRTDSGKLVAANFENLFGKGSINNGMNAAYMLYDKYDHLIVPDEIYDEYLKLAGDTSTCLDPQMFAMHMTTGASMEEIQKAEKSLGEPNSSTTLADSKEQRNTAWQAVLEILGVEESNLPINPDASSSEIIDSIKEAYNPNAGAKGSLSEQAYNDLCKALEAFGTANDKYRYQLYQKMGETICDSLTEGSADFDYNTYNYYLRYAKMIEKEGGLCATSPANRDSVDNFSTDKELLNEMLKAGSLWLDTVTIGRDGKIDKAQTSTSTDSNVSFVNTSNIDSTALKKAEVEYNQAMKKIDRQDKQYDLELNRLETERSALTTEYDSVKKVIQDNIERTFGIFS